MSTAKRITAVVLRPLEESVLLPPFVLRVKDVTVMPAMFGLLRRLFKAFC